jgi:sec-independent protein translocase protein TatA
MLNFAAVGVGPVEIIIVLAILLLLFGAKRLPEVGRSLGTGMREFKDSVTGKDRRDEPQQQLEASDRQADAGGTAERPAEPAPSERAGTAGETRS